MWLCDQAPVGVVYHTWVGICCCEFIYQIWSFYLLPFQKYRGVQNYKDSPWTLTTHRLGQFIICVLVNLCTKSELLKCLASAVPKLKDGQMTLTRFFDPDQFQNVFVFLVPRPGPKNTKSFMNIYVQQFELFLFNAKMANLSVLEKWKNQSWI